MRLFNEKEKLIIKKLVNESLYTLMYLPINLFDDIFNSRNVGFDGNDMQLVFPHKELDNQTRDDEISIYNEILNRVLLIDYLEKEGLVYIVPVSSSINKQTEIGNICRINTTSLKIDENIGNILLKCMNHPIYISETLRNYVNNGFKSLEEQALYQAKIQTKNSQTQTLLSTIAVIISVIGTSIASIQSCCNNRQNSLIVERVSLDINTMNNELRKNIHYMDTLMENTTEIKTKLSDFTNLIDSCISKKLTLSNTTQKSIPNICTDTKVSKSLKDSLVE